MSFARRSRLRLVLRDLAAGAAFVSMALSGELPLWTIAAFGTALLCALADRRVLRLVPRASGVVLVVGAIALYSSAAAGGLDLVVSACAFAALITAQRMLSEPSARTDQQVHLTGLLMIAGGAALSGELLFAVALAVYATLACLSLLLAVMEGSAGPGERVASGPALRFGAWGMAAALGGAVVLFAVFPRLSWNVAGGRVSRGLGSATGLNSAGLQLTSGGGTIKTNPRVVARVELSPDPRTDRLDAYFLAATFGTFTGTAWTGSAEDTAPSQRVTVRPYLDGQTPLLRQRFELLPALGANVALGMVETVAFSGARTQTGSSHGQTRLVHRPGQDVRFRDRAELYAYVALSARKPDELPAPPPLEEAERAALISLPEGLDPRIAELARTQLAGEQDPLRAGRRLETWLQSTFRYTLDLPETEGDPLAHFLFERRAGHCEYFASALAVMLRTQGIPARVATGFYGGERTDDDGTYVLRAGDAHAWTQVWVDGRGFVNLDATPAAGRAARPSAVLGWLLRQYEAVEGMWRNSVLEYSLRDQARLVMRAWERVRGDGAQVASSGSGTTGGLPKPTRELWMLLGAFALLLYGYWRLRRVLSRGRSSHPATLLRDLAEAMLARAGVPAVAGEGFEERAERMRAEGHAAASALREVVEAWTAARFGGRELSAVERRRLLVALKEALRQR